MSDATLSTLKTVGAVVAALYGLYATVTDFKVGKEGEKKLSRAGWIGLAILFVATVLNLSTDYVSRQQDAKQHRDDAKERGEQQTAVARIGESLSRELNETITLNRALSETSKYIKSTAHVSRENQKISSENLVQTQRVLDPIKPFMRALLTLRLTRHQQAVEAFADRVALDRKDPFGRDFNIEGGDVWPDSDDPAERDLARFLNEISFTVSFKSKGSAPQEYNLHLSGTCTGMSLSPGPTTSPPSLSVFPNHDLSVSCAPNIMIMGDDPDLKSYQDLVGKSVQIGFEPAKGETLLERMQILKGNYKKSLSFKVENFILTTGDSRNIDLGGLKTGDCIGYAECATSPTITGLSVQRDVFSTALRRGVALRKEEHKPR